MVLRHLPRRLLHVVDVTVDALLIAERAAGELGNSDEDRRDAEAKDALPAHHVAGFLAGRAEFLQQVLLDDALARVEDLPDDHAGEADGDLLS